MYGVCSFLLTFFARVYGKLAKAILPFFPTMYANESNVIKPCDFLSFDFPFTRTVFTIDVHFDKKKLWVILKRKHTERAREGEMGEWVSVRGGEGSAGKWNR